MQNFVTNAINLKSYPLSETDKIVVMYSKDKGLIRGVAKGSKKPKSKLGGRMDTLVANRLMLYKGKNLNTIAQAEALNTFNKIRVDMDKLLYSMYCAEIVMNFGVENDPSSEEIFDLFYACLSRIAECSEKVEVMLAVMRFQLKMMNILGYALELQKCAICNCELSDEEIYFSLKNGGVVCESCKGSLVSLKKMNVKLKDFLLTLQQTDFTDKTRYDELANETISAFCFNLLKDYIAQFSPKKFKTIDTLTALLV